MRSGNSHNSRPLRTRRGWAVTAVLAAFLCGSAAGEEFEQHHAHEHGKVTLNVAVDAAALLVELDAPAVNVVGFEHSPPDACRSARRPGMPRSSSAQAGA